MSTKNVLLIVLVLGLVAVTPLISTTIKSKKEAADLRAKIEELQKTSPAASAEEVQTVVAEVGRLIALPTDETPTLATVTDKDKLKEIPFFAQAETGDKVLIYVKARKAYLYRPNDKKLVEVAAINLSPDARVNAEFSSTIFLRNGGGTAGLTKLVEDDLKKVLPNAKITGRDNATDTYDTTMVVDLKGDKKTQAEQVAQLFAAKVVDLPEGEVRPGDTDILLLIGKDVATRAAAAQAKASPSPTNSPAPSPTATPRPTATPAP